MRARQSVSRFGESGQALVEFAIVLPLLLILSFGTLEVGLYLQHRLILGGAAFVAARAAAVQGPKATATVRQILLTYAQDSHSPWISQVAGTAKVVAETPQRVRVTVTRQGDAWTGLLTGSIALEGGTLQPPSRWAAGAPVTWEFVTGNHPPESAAHSPTDEMIDYPVRVPWQGVFPDFSGLLHSVPAGAGASGPDMLLVLDPAEQAVAENPYNRHMGGNTSPSKVYVGTRYEDAATTNAAMLDTGIAKLEVVMGLFYTAYTTTTLANPVSPVMTAVVAGFAKADQSVHFDKLAQNIGKAEQGIFKHL